MYKETGSFRKKVLVSGGGIAGLTLAYWLHKHGHQPIVIEKAEEIRSEIPNSGQDIEDGYVLYLQPNRQCTVYRLENNQVLPFFIYKADNEGSI